MRSAAFTRESSLDDLVLLDEKLVIKFIDSSWGVSCRAPDTGLSRHIHHEPHTSIVKWKNISDSSLSGLQNESS